MSRTHVHRRQRRRSEHTTRGDLSVVPGLALVGSFVIGIVLEWLRTYAEIFQTDWRADMLAILVAAWICVALLSRDAGHDLLRRSALVLGLLMLGSLVMHSLLTHV